MSASHWLWAGLGALAIWPLKHVWDNWIEKFWTAFWISFKAGFKQTPAGQEFLKAYHDSRAKKDKEILAAHPELQPMLTCKTCGGTGKGVLGMCEDCYGTGLV
jgi:hypothetical protein